MPPNVTVREATPADEPVLRQLQHELREFDPSFLSYALSGPPLVLVAGAGEGYLVALLDDEAYLAELVVDPASRRRGIGSTLLDTLHERARAAGSDAVELVVHPENEVGIAFYEANGYRRVGERAEFYDGASGIVMRRPV